MRRTKWVVGLVAGIAVVTSLSPDTLGQALGEGRVLITPGDMVNAGLGRAQAAVRDPFSVTPITETAETIAQFDDPADSGTIENPEDLVADAIRQLTVNAISQLFAVIANGFLTSIGLPELFPTEFLADLPDLSGLAPTDGTDQADGSPDEQENRADEVPDDRAGDTGTSGGRPPRPRGG